MTQDPWEAELARRKQQVAPADPWEAELAKRKAQTPQLDKPAPSGGGFREALRRVGETAMDIGYAGLSNIPGVPTVAGVVEAGLSRARGQPKSIKQGAMEWQAATEAAQSRSPVLASPLSPAAIAGGAVPYLLPVGQSTRLARALYSAGVGGARATERGVLADEAPADIAKSAAIGAALESATGFLAGEPAGAVARAKRTPTRATQVMAQREATRKAETPLYEAFTGYAGAGSPPTRGPLPVTPKLAGALNDPMVRRAIRVARQNPDFAPLPSTSPVILDRAYKVIGSKAFADKYSVGTEASKRVRDILREGMDEASPSLPYSDVLAVASRGRKTGEAIGRGAESLRVASSASPGTLRTALRSGEDAFGAYLAQATPEQRRAAIEGVFGYLREAPMFAGIPLGARARVPIPVIPSRAARVAPRLQQLAGGSPTMLQRGVRGAVAGAPASIGEFLRQQF